jgi:hypothetical protein
MPPPPLQKGDEVRFILSEGFLILEGKGNVIWISLIEVAVRSNSISLPKEREGPLNGF